MEDKKKALKGGDPVLGVGGQSLYKPLHFKDFHVALAFQGESMREREGEGERESESEMKLRHGRIYCPENSILLSDSKSPVPPASENLFSTF